MKDAGTLTRDEWYQIVEEFEKSKLTQATFCKQKGLSLCRFGYYVKKLRILKTTEFSKPSFSSVVMQRDNNLKVHEIKVELPNGFKCYLPTTIHSEQLKKILSALLTC